MGNGVTGSGLRKSTPVLATSGDGSGQRAEPEDANLKVVGVSKRFEGVQALRNVTLEIPMGRFFSILGPSGGGKSTLLRILAGFEKPDEGHILLRGRDITGVEAKRRPTAMVFQRLALFPHMSVFENIAFGLRVSKLRRDEIAGRIHELLSISGLLGLERRKPSELSGGQQQRVALARALAPKPVVLLLDEPMSALDMKLRSQMQDELKRLQREVQTTFVYVTHDQSEAMAMSDRVAVINDGVIEQVGSPRSLYDSPTSRFVADFIGESNVLDLSTDGSLPTLDGHPVRLAAPSGGEGQALTISIRPERIQISERADDPAEAIPATVVEASFMGPSVRYMCAVAGSERRIVCRVPYSGSEKVLVPGSNVSLHWEPAAASFVSRSEG